MKNLQKFLIKNNFKIIHPYFWNIKDSFQWLKDWCKNHNVNPQDISDLFANLKCGKILCEEKFEFFQKYSDQYSSEIFEDLHLTVASHNDNTLLSVVKSNKRKLKIPKICLFLYVSIYLYDIYKMNYFLKGLKLVYQ